MTWTPRTPAEAWPTRLLKGRPGYSARGLNSVSPPAETPLSVACTITEQRIHDAVAAEFEARRLAGGTVEESVAWLSVELNERKRLNYEHLRASFDAVVAALETGGPACRAFLREARRMSKRAVAS